MIEPPSQYSVALSLWTLALQFFSLADNAARETAVRGNTWVVTSDHPIDEHYYEEETRWSDHAIIAATLFNLLHGLELLVKGFLIARGVAIRKEHKISRLRQMFSHEFPNEADLNNFVAKYASLDGMPAILRDFVRENAGTVDSLYNDLRYPTPDFVATLTYAPLKYKGRDGVAFFAELHDDIEMMRRAAVALGRRLKPSDARPEAQ